MYRWPINNGMRVLLTIEYLTSTTCLYNMGHWKLGECPLDWLSLWPLNWLTRPQTGWPLTSELTHLATDWMTFEEVSLILVRKRSVPPLRMSRKPLPDWSGSDPYIPKKSTHKPNISVNNGISVYISLCLKHFLHPEWSSYFEAM